MSFPLTVFIQDKTIKRGKLSYLCSSILPCSCFWRLAPKNSIFLHSVCLFCHHYCCLKSTSTPRRSKFQSKQIEFYCFNQGNKLPFLQDPVNSEGGIFLESEENLNLPFVKFALAIFLHLTGENFQLAPKCPSSIMDVRRFFA